MTIDVFTMDGAPAGSVTAAAQGPRTVFNFEGEERREVLRLVLTGAGKARSLGIPAPEGGKLRLRRTMTRLELGDFDLRDARGVLVSPETDLSELTSALPEGEDDAGETGDDAAPEPAPSETEPAAPEPGEAPEEPEAGRETKAEACDSPEAEACDSPEAEACDGPEAEVCDGPEAEACDSPEAEACDSPEAEACDGPKAEACDGPVAETCDGPDAEACDGPDAEACDGSDAETCDGPDTETCDGLEAETAGEAPAEDGPGQEAETGDAPEPGDMTARLEPATVEGWYLEPDPARHFADPELKKAAAGTEGAWLRRDGADTLLAFPWSPAAPFPMIPAFRFGTAASVGGREFMVFRLREGVPV